MLRAFIPAALLLLTASPYVLPARTGSSQVIRSLGARASTGRPLPLHVGGRVVHLKGYVRQWPGTYWEAAFRGPAVDLSIGAGAVSLRIRVDGDAPLSLVRPTPGVYRVAAHGPGKHRIRVDVVSESQAGPTAFHGIFAPRGTTPLPAPQPRMRQIEFIGDSHTVGYGNTSSTRVCSQDAIWQTTNTLLGPAGVTAAHYDADYQVNAISGRGVVRNYGGFAAPTLPQAYPFALLNSQILAARPDWHPQIIVIALGTNDFSTPLKTGERWPDREALHRDFEGRYVAFVQTLRQKNPNAYFILWATNLADGEIAQEVSRVAQRLSDSGEKRVRFVPVNGLSFQGCDAHPDAKDDRAIAEAIAHAIDSVAGIWTR